MLRVLSELQVLQVRMGWNWCFSFLFLCIFISAGEVHIKWNQISFSPTPSFSVLSKIMGYAAPYLFPKRSPQLMDMLVWLGTDFPPDATLPFLQAWDHFTGNTQACGPLRLWLAKKNQPKNTPWYFVGPLDLMMANILYGIISLSLYNITTLISIHSRIFTKL